jgi:hypothetical protein
VNIYLAVGGYFDVNGLGAGSTYTLGNGATLNAAGTGTTSGSTQAEIHGNATGTVSLGAQPISLTFTPTVFTGDTTHPSLVISQGALQLNNNIITISNAAATALGAGTYRVIQVGNGTSGSLSGTPNSTPFISGKGLAAGATASLSVSSGNVNLVVVAGSPTATSTTLNSLSASTYGSSVTLTATVSPAPTGGTVQFYDNGVAIGSPVTVTSGMASYGTSVLWAGSHPITAAYGGASGYAPSVTASASTQTVNPAALSITAGNDSKNYGQTKSYGAGSTAFTSIGLQTGDVISSVTITNSGGSASDAPVGSYSLTPGAPVGASFNANNYAITYINGTLNVVQAAPGLVIVSSLNPAGYLTPLQFTASAFTTNATGTVIFLTNGVAWSTNAVGNGSAPSPSVSTLPRGTNLVTAIYSGDNNILPGTNSLSQIVTNHPPIANVATVTRIAGISSLKIALTDLATNWSDADADTVTFVSAGTSTNGVLVTTNSGYVFYSNTNNVSDQFSYAIADSYGGTNIGYVNIVVSSTSLFGQGSPAIDTSAGSPTLTFAGIPGYGYNVARSTNMIVWTVIWTTNAPSTGVFQFTDTSAPSPTAFYQLQYNP